MNARARLFVAALALCAGVAAAPASRSSLVPDRPGTTPSYWCTWTAQGNRTSPGNTFGADVDVPHERIAEEVNERTVFGPGGWAHTLYPKVRGDLFLMFDVGWDVPAGESFDKARWKLGRVEIAGDKFPCCAAPGAEGLRRLNDETKAAGWRAAGLWIAAHAYGDGREQLLRPLAEIEGYFRERLRWSHDAGIGYWKVDYGARHGDLAFRRMLTRLAAEVAPGLLVEHARGGGPVNDDNAPWDSGPAHHSGRFASWHDGAELRRSIEVVRIGPVFRTYDTITVFSVPTTLDRVVPVLSALGDDRGVTGLINCEDEPYIAAGLGLAMGIMRYPIPAKPGFEPRADEVTRAVRWQRLAPAFAVGAAATAVSDRVLVDRWRFAKGDSWATWLEGQELPQGAPAVSARGLPLPRVAADGEPPFVVASRHPSGATAVATLPRRLVGRGEFMPLADVTVEVVDASQPVGVFGEYRTLTLALAAGRRVTRVLAQDLAADRTVDVTGRVALQAGSVTIPGAVIAEVGRSAQTPGDFSRPGLVLRLE
ncbi:MAG TPA: hypothetical protein VE359_20370 [Vicinamibacteria bacterium]|nr:hypothetical protein [Vicinamibacteria bacterium]